MGDRILVAALATYSEECLYPQASVRTLIGALQRPQVHEGGPSGRGCHRWLELEAQGCYRSPRGRAGVRR